MTPTFTLLAKCRYDAEIFLSTFSSATITLSLLESDAQTT
jgi:hypothetical protein